MLLWYLGIYSTVGMLCSAAKTKIAAHRGKGSRVESQGGNGVEAKCPIHQRISEEERFP